MCMVQFDSSFNSTQTKYNNNTLKSILLRLPYHIKKNKNKVTSNDQRIEGVMNLYLRKVDVKEVEKAFK